MGINWNIFKRKSWLRTKLKYNFKISNYFNTILHNGLYENTWHDMT